MQGCIQGGEDFVNPRGVAASGDGHAAQRPSMVPATMQAPTSKPLKPTVRALAPIVSQLLATAVQPARSMKNKSECGV